MTSVSNDHDALIEQTAQIVKSYVSNNHVPRDDLAGLIASISSALNGVAVAQPATAEPEPLSPAVPIKKSVTPDYLVCLEDGKHFKSLKRHLASRYGMSPEDYRAKWGLPKDYPMVAVNYAARRSELAKNMGLGRKARREIA